MPLPFPLMCKCIPISLYGLEACPLKKADLHSLDFVINRFCKKLFKTNNEVINVCQEYVCFRLPSNLTETEKKLIRNIIIIQTYAGVLIAINHK